MSHPRQRIELARGAAIADHLEALGRLRLEVFCEYPYLYAGDLENERRNLARYPTSPDSLLAQCRDGQEMIGACTGIPLQLEGGELARQFAADLARTYYLGEILIRPGHRGRGLGTRLLATLLDALDPARYPRVCLCMVERPGDHPGRPSGYRSPASLALRFGFRRDPERSARFRWKDVGDGEVTEKTMSVWVREA